jgi:predicted RNase H-like HicB family nuclease
MYTFLIIVEKVDNTYSVYSPDLPGCVATGKTREEAEANVHEAIAFHIEGLKEDDLPIPEGTSSASWIQV